MKRLSLVIVFVLLLASYGFSQTQTISILPSAEEDMLIELYSLEGKLLMSKQQRVGSDGSRVELDFPYTSGLYILKIIDSHNATVIKKIVK